MHERHPQLKENPLNLSIKSIEKSKSQQALVKEKDVLKEDTLPK